MFLSLINKKQPLLRIHTKWFHPSQYRFSDITSKLNNYFLDFIDVRTQ